MLGKIHRPQREALTQVCVQVFDNDHAVGFAGSQGPSSSTCTSPSFCFTIRSRSNCCPTRDSALSLGYLTAAQFDEWVRPDEMTHPLGQHG
jgi:fumarate hydratase class II